MKISTTIKVDGSDDTVKDTTDTAIGPTLEGQLPLKWRTKASHKPIINYVNINSISNQ